MLASFTRSLQQSQLVALYDACDCKLKHDLEYIELAAIPQTFALRFSGFYKNSFHMVCFWPLQNKVL